jgi:hypothetical protein
MERLFIISEGVGGLIVGSSGIDGLAVGVSM